MKLPPDTTQADDQPGAPNQVFVGTCAIEPSGGVEVAPSPAGPAVDKLDNDPLGKFHLDEVPTGPRFMDYSSSLNKGDRPGQVVKLPAAIGPDMQNMPRIECTPRERGPAAAMHTENSLGNNIEHEVARLVDIIHSDKPHSDEVAAATSALSGTTTHMVPR